MPEPDPQPGDAPAPASQRWIAIAAAVFLLVQLAIPLRYYLNTPTPDERFAWRMFSSVRMVDADGVLIDVVEVDGKRTQRPVPIEAVVTWRNALDTQRPDVVEKLMRWRFAHPHVVAVRYVRTGRTPEGEPIPTVRLVLDSPDGDVRIDGGDAP